MDISIMIICALLCLCVRLIFGFNFWLLITSASLITFILPAFLIPLYSHFEMTQSMVNRVDLYVVALTEALPSMITGELAGIFLKDVLRLPKALFDYVRSLF